MNFFVQFSGDYGLAIILLTVSVRILMLPLTIKQTKSMQAMKKLQPKLKQLQEKYKNDRQKLNEEIMKFYSEHKVNPLSGCLPMLLQLPILFALFRVLHEAGKGPGHSFLFIISDISLSASKAQAGLGAAAMIPYFLLAGLMVVTTYIQSKMMSSGDAQQDRAMLFISAFMAYLGWTLPAGVLLYLLVSNVWTIAQQHFTARGAETAS